MATGQLIIIEAGDGSGKATQTQLLYDALVQRGYRVKKVSYPDYDSPGCMPVKMYLNGELGPSAEAVNAYAASILFAVDRFTSYKTTWQQYYEDGYIIIADRYTTSNMVHQAVKIHDPVAREEFLNWLYDIEYVKMGLPQPSRVIYLDMPAAMSYELLTKRAERQHREKDIHEQDYKYLEQCHLVYNEIAQKYNWLKIQCVEDNKLRDIRDIHQEIIRKLGL